MSLRLWLRPLLVVLAAVLCFLGAYWTYGEEGLLGSVELMETQAADTLFRWRQRWFPGRVLVDPRIHLLTIDRATERAWGKPSLLWPEELARVSQKLLEDGALAVGIDVAVDPDLSHTPEAIKELVGAGYVPLQDVLTTGKVVLIENDMLQDVQEPAWPAAVAAFAEDGRNSCSGNFLADPDGVIRRVPLVGLKSDRGWVHHTWSVRLAELALGRDFPWENPPFTLRHDSIRVNFPGAAGCISQASLADYLQRGGDVRGKVILLIPDLPADRHPTPFVAGGGRYSLGGEIHAAALNTLLTGQFLRRPERLHWCLIVALGCALFGGLAAVSSPARALLWFVVATPAYAMVCLAAFLHQGWMLPIWSVLAASLVGLFTGLIGQFLSLEERRRGLHLLLRRMVSHQVAEALLQRASVRAERRQITLLFSDINGFTPTCERLAPEQVLSMLNVYFEEMVTLIDRRGGYVKQFVGDEIMAIYGAPQASATHPRDAVYTAIDMMECLQSLRERDPEGSRGFYSVKIGINTGEAVLGSVGSSERWEYAAVGDDVNLAARLESLTTKLGVEILVSRFTRDLVDKLPTGWNWKSLGIQQFKGKNSQVEVFTLERER